MFGIEAVTRLLLGADDGNDKSDTQTHLRANGTATTYSAAIRTVRTNGTYAPITHNVPKPPEHTQMDEITDLQRTRILKNAVRLALGAQTQEERDSYISIAREQLFAMRTRMSTYEFTRSRLALSRIRYQ